jgi:hypothetical protein
MLAAQSAPAVENAVEKCREQRCFAKIMFRNLSADENLAIEAAHAQIPFHTFFGGLLMFCSFAS